MEFIVSRRRDHDRRKVELQLTPAAAGTIDGLIELIVDRLNWALANFNGSEVQKLQRLLEKLTTTLQSAVEPGAAEPKGAGGGAQTPSAGGAPPATRIRRRSRPN